MAQKKIEQFQRQPASKDVIIRAKDALIAAKEKLFILLRRVITDLTDMSSEPEMGSRQRLVTSIGDYLDRTSYRLIAIIIIGTILSSALVFWLAGTAIAGGLTVGPLDALYFSVITFTSLGYGDIIPTGIGKLVASIEVLSGLVFIAVLVGKLASERQSALLLLIYTSEQQHRISAFSRDLRAFKKRIDRAANDYDHKRLDKQARKLYKLISSIHNYLRFQSSQGRLASFGNTSALSMLYRRITSLHATVLDAFLTPEIEPATYKKLEKSLRRMAITSSVMLEFHKSDPHTTALLEELQTQGQRLEKWNRLKAQGQEASMVVSRPTPTKRLLKKVEEVLPATPWDRDLDKEVAATLRIPRKVAGRCIAIIKRGREPEAP